MTAEEIKAWYKEWCQETGRNGGNLIGSSISELLNDFNQQKSKAVQELVEKIDALELDPNYSSHYHWGASMMKDKIKSILTQ